MGVWCNWALCVLLLCSCIGSILASTQSKDIEIHDYEYDRMDEVKKACDPYLSSDANLHLPKGEESRMISSLSFRDGNWFQVGAKAPLMPYMSYSNSSHSRSRRRRRIDPIQSPSNLASFELLDVHSSSPFENSVSVYGVLHLDMSTGWSMFHGRSSSSFEFFPGYSSLSVGFQGVYWESNENGGEGVMCLLGDAELPSRSDDPNNPWPWATLPKWNHTTPAHLSHDDQILLVLRYPLRVNLSRLAIKGVMKSLNPVSKKEYFDEVRLLSLSDEVVSNYRFSSEKVLSGVCDPYPYADSSLNRQIDVYEGSDFCKMLRQATSSYHTALTILPNWRCNRSQDLCRKLGPFETDKAIEATNGASKGAQLLMQNILCETHHVKRKNVTEAKVFAVFRVVSQASARYGIRRRNWLGNSTLVAEGRWSSSSGQLCMVGCTVTMDSEENTCDSRICMYITTSLSITQRSLLFGSISSIKTDEAAYFPLSFERPVSGADMWDAAALFSRLRYQYSKLVSLATDETADFQGSIKPKLFQYPKLEEAEDYMDGLSHLSEDLTHSGTLRESNSSSTYISIEVLSLGSLLGRQWWASINYSSISRTSYRKKAPFAKQQPLLNVSATLILEGENYVNFSAISLEGRYDSRTGVMNLTGCRDVRSFSKIPFDSEGLEAGFDCSIEGVLHYPPTKQWLTKRGAEISISSKRKGDDPLYFNQINLETSPVFYRNQREDILSRIGLERILRVLTLSLAVFIILSQVLHIRKPSVADFVPYMSLVMLGVQALGYGVPLVADVEALFKKKSSESYGISQPQYMVSRNLEGRIVDFMVKLIVLICLLLTLRLCQKVSKSRTRLLVQSSNEPSRVPSDKVVLLATSIIHIIGYIVILSLRFIKSDQTVYAMAPYGYEPGNSTAKLRWETQLDEYIGLVQDLFLLPQVVGNFIWQANSQPLRKVYYMGITVLRLLPHAYDLFSPPTPYFGVEYEFVDSNRDFYSKSYDIVISSMALVLAVIVYIQQRRNVGRSRSTFGLSSVLPVGSRGYKRVSSKDSEAELVSGVRGRHHGGNAEADV